jgi:hypothetical protein
MANKNEALTSGCDRFLDQINLKNTIINSRSSSNYVSDTEDLSISSKSFNNLLILVSLSS